MGLPDNASPRALLLPAVLVAMLLFSSCTPPATTADGIWIDFGRSERNVSVLPIPNGTPVGRTSAGSLVIAVLNNLDGAYPMGVYCWDALTEPPVGLVRISAQRNLFRAVLVRDTLVWVETDGGMIMGDWSLRAKDLASGQEWEIDHARLKPEDTPVVVPTLFAPPISSDGSTLVWTAFEPGGAAGSRAVLRMCDVVTGNTEVLDQVEDISLSELGTAAVSGDYVVYNPGYIDLAQNSRYGTIVLFDLATRERKVLDEGYRVCSPAICGRYVVWASGSYSIKLYDIQAEAERTLVASRDGEVWSPGVNDEVVTWLHNGDKVFVAPADAGGATDAEVRAVGPAIGGGTISGTFLYWRERTKGGGVVTKYIDFLGGG